MAVAFTREEDYEARAADLLAEETDLATTLARTWEAGDTCEREGDEYALGKYDRANAIRLRDVLFLCTLSQGAIHVIRRNPSGAKAVAKSFTRQIAVAAE